MRIFWAIVVLLVAAGGVMLVADTSASARGSDADHSASSASAQTDSGAPSSTEVGPSGSAPDASEPSSRLALGTDERVTNGAALADAESEPSATASQSPALEPAPVSTESGEATEPLASGPESADEQGASPEAAARDESAPVGREAAASQAQEPMPAEAERAPGERDAAAPAETEAPEPAAAASASEIEDSVQETAGTDAEGAKSDAPSGDERDDVNEAAGESTAQEANEPEAADAAPAAVTPAGQDPAGQDPATSAWPAPDELSGEPRGAAGAEQSEEPSVESADAEADREPARDAAGAVVKRDDGSYLVDGQHVITGSGTRSNPYTTSWELLVGVEQSFNPRAGRDELPAWTGILDGSWVRLEGYLLLPVMSQNVTELLLMRNQWDGCCIGVPPTAYDAVEVKLAERDKLSRLSVNHGTILGKFKVDPYLSGKWLIGLYLLEEARLESAMGVGASGQ